MNFYETFIEASCAKNIHIGENRFCSCFFLSFFQTERKNLLHILVFTSFLWKGNKGNERHYIAAMVHKICYGFQLLVSIYIRNVF